MTWLRPLILAWCGGAWLMIAVLARVLGNPHSALAWLVAIGFTVGAVLVGKGDKRG